MVKTNGETATPRCDSCSRPGNRSNDCKRGLWHGFTRSMQSSIRVSVRVEHSLALLFGYAIIGAGATIVVINMVNN
jgi:hypothetical protein